MRGLPLTVVGLFVAISAASADDATLPVKLRSRLSPVGQPPVAAREVATNWNPKRTAIVVCDMWDRHWCRSAEARCGELAVSMNAMLQAARAQGVFIVHAPSACMKFYQDTPQRKRAQSAPYSQPPMTLSTTPRWGTAWCYSDPSREAILPIDATDDGCDCEKPCPTGAPWTRQAAAIEIGPDDAITDNGQEIWNLFAERKIDNVVLCGVHLNMCVLGRPFGIRQMVRVGKNVALMRDMTDTMYNPKRPPGVHHFAGTDLMVEHVERYWCPSLTSTTFTGKPAFRFRDDPRTEK